MRSAIILFLFRAFMSCSEQIFTCIFSSVTRKEEEELGESDGTKEKQHDLSPKTWGRLLRCYCQLDI
jgi:hypothetical protein